MCIIDTPESLQRTFNGNCSCFCFTQEQASPQQSYEAKEMVLSGYAALSRDIWFFLLHPIWC